jgi:hypothetical protein
MLTSEERLRRLLIRLEEEIVDHWVILWKGNQKQSRYQLGDSIFLDLSEGRHLSLMVVASSGEDLSKLGMRISYSKLTLFGFKEITESSGFVFDSTIGTITTLPLWIVSVPTHLLAIVRKVELYKLDTVNSEG